MILKGPLIIIIIRRRIFSLTCAVCRVSAWQAGDEGLSPCNSIYIPTLHFLSNFLVFVLVSLSVTGLQLYH